MAGLELTKTELLARMEQEEKSVKILNESLERSNQVTTHMVSILSTFESRLHKLEQTILPIYSDTRSLQKQLENADLLLQQIDSVQGYHLIAEKMRPAIELPSDMGIVDLDSYVSAMDELLEAKRYFEQNFPASNELSAINDLLAVGVDKLTEEFRMVLQKNNASVSVELLLGNPMDDSLNNDDNVSIGAAKLLSDEAISSLYRIAQWLSVQSHQTHCDIFCEYRRNALLKALEGVKSHMNHVSSNLVAESPQISRTRRSEKGPSLTNKLTKMISYTRQLPSVSDPVKLLKEDTLGTDTAKFCTSVSTMARLLRYEQFLVREVLPEHVQLLCFDRLANIGFKALISDGEAICKTVKKAVVRQEKVKPLAHMFSVLNVFSILTCLRDNRDIFDRLLVGCKKNTLRHIPSLISSFDDVGHRTFCDIIEAVKNTAMDNMPEDGTVHELTTNVLGFLESLVIFRETVGAMLMGYERQSLPSVPDHKKNEVKCAEYAVKLLSALGLNLTNRAKSYTDQTLHDIFLLNNYNYILKALKDTDLGRLILRADKNVVDEYFTLIKQYKKKYQLSFGKALAFIAEERDVLAQPVDPTRLSDKFRQTIKDRCNGFNKELEDQCKLQEMYCVADPELRNALKKATREQIVPAYKAFKSKYANSGFTKNIDKYLKFSADDVVTKLDTVLSGYKSLS